MPKKSWKNFKQTSPPLHYCLLFQAILQPPEFEEGFKENNKFKYRVYAAFIVIAFVMNFMSLMFAAFLYINCAAIKPENVKHFVSSYRFVIADYLQICMFMVGVVCGGVGVSIAAYHLYGRYTHATIMTVPFCADLFNTGKCRIVPLLWCLPSLDCLGCLWVIFQQYKSTKSITKIKLTLNVNFHKFRIHHCSLQYQFEALIQRVNCWSQCNFYFQWKIWLSWQRLNTVLPNCRYLSHMHVYHSLSLQKKHLYLA